MFLDCLGLFLDREIGAVNTIYGPSSMVYIRSIVGCAPFTPEMAVP
jgi:hypothetical protein